MSDLFSALSLGVSRVWAPVWPQIFRRYWSWNNFDDLSVPTASCQLLAKVCALSTGKWLMTMLDMTLNNSVDWAVKPQVSQSFTFPNLVLVLLQASFWTEKMALDNHFPIVLKWLKYCCKWCKKGWGYSPSRLFHSFRAEPVRKVSSIKRGEQLHEFRFFAPLDVTTSRPSWMTSYPVRHLRWHPVGHLGMLSHLVGHVGWCHSTSLFAGMRSPFVSNKKTHVFFFFHARASCVLGMRYLIYPYCSRVLFLSGGRPCYGQKSLNREVHVRCLLPYCFSAPSLLWNAIFDSVFFFFFCQLKITGTLALQYLPCPLEKMAGKSRITIIKFVM